MADGDLPADPAPPELQDRLLARVGLCLNAWSWVEIELLHLYMTLLGLRKNDFNNPARATFECVISLEVRISILQAFVKAHSTLQNDYFPHLERLGKRVIKLYKKRHELAHFVVLLRVKKGKAVPVIRPFFTFEAYFKESGPELGISEVSERYRLIRELGNDIERHVQHVGLRLNLPQEYYLRAGDRAYPPLEPKELIKAAPSTPLPLVQE